MTDVARYQTDPEYKAWKLAIQKAYYLRTKAAGANEARAARYRADPAFREARKAASRKSDTSRYHRSDIRASLVALAKHRAKKKGLNFNLTVEDVVVPERCPVLGCVLERGKGKGPKRNSPTLDRIDSAKGYVSGNVRVISFRANALKSDASLEEIAAVYADALRIARPESIG